MREKILAEIRRVAAANGGRPPGRRVFERVTGIRPSTWLGVHWARWSEAIRDAGLVSNRMPVRTEDDVLLAKLAAASRHLGKFPTAVELRMYKRAGGDVPTSRTLRDRFGTWADVRRRLAQWAAAWPERADIGPLLGSAPLPIKALARREGFVYLLRSAGFCKIGRSTDFERRLKEIRVTLPEATVLLHAIRTDDPPGIEIYWHRRFSNRRSRGEWFKLTAQDIVDFKRRKYQ